MSFAGSAAGPANATNATINTAAGYAAPQFGGQAAAAVASSKARAAPRSAPAKVREQGWPRAAACTGVREMCSLLARVWHAGLGLGARVDLYARLVRGPGSGRCDVATGHGARRRRRRRRRRRPPSLRPVHRCTPSTVPRRGPQAKHSVEIVTKRGSAAQRKKKSRFFTRDCAYPAQM